MAAAAFLARYGGRTLETYRYDLRTFFQWCTDVGLGVLEAKRAHIELWRSAMEERGLAASTIDRRLVHNLRLLPLRPHRRPDQSTQPNTSAGPRSTQAKGVAWTAGARSRSSSPLSATTPIMPLWPRSWASTGLRVSEACGTNVEDLGFDRGHRTLRIIGKGNKPAVIPLVPRAARAIDLAIGERCKGRDPAPS